MRHIDLEVREILQREHSALVLDHHHTLLLCLKSLVHVFRVSDDGFRSLDIKIWILEKTNSEYVEQQSVSGSLHSCPHPILTMLLHAHGISIKDRLLLIVASELVASGHYHLVMAFRLCKMLHTPWLSEMLACMNIFLSDRPVRTYDSVISGLVAEHLADDLTIETVCHILGSLIVCNCVIRHYSSSLFCSFSEFERTFDKRDLMHLEIVARIYGKLAEAQMGVTAGLARATARPVLHHGVHTALSPATLRPAPEVSFQNVIAI